MSASAPVVKASQLPQGVFLTEGNGGGGGGRLFSPLF